MKEEYVVTVSYQNNFTKPEIFRLACRQNYFNFLTNL